MVWQNCPFRSTSRTLTCISELSGWTRNSRPRIKSSQVNSFYCQSIQIMTATMRQYKQFGVKGKAQQGTIFPLARDIKIVNKYGKKQYTSSYVFIILN